LDLATPFNFLNMPAMGIFRAFSASVFFCSLVGCIQTNPTVDHQQLANECMQKGDIAANESKFDEALAFYETGLSHALNFSDKGDMIVEFQSKIRQTKAKSLVYHFKSDQILARVNRNDLLPATLETKDFIVLQSSGVVSLNRIWTDSKIDNLRNFFGMGRKITVFPKSGIEFIPNGGQKLISRVVGPAGFLQSDSSKIEVYSGIYLFSAKERPSNLIIEYPLGELTIEPSTPFAFILEITTNGGCKIIGLLGELNFNIADKTSVRVAPGELVFAMNDDFSRKMTVELSTLMATSSLFTDFEEPPELFKKMRQQALIQALRTKRHYRALVGDAKTLDDFEVQVLEEEDLVK
jgi:hypothetical protein